MIYVRSITCMSWRLIYQNQNGVSVLLRDFVCPINIPDHISLPIFLSDYWILVHSRFLLVHSRFTLGKLGFAFEVRSINRPVIYLTTCKSRPLYIRNTHVVSDFRGLYSFDWGLLFTLHLLWVYSGLTLGLL